MHLYLTLSIDQKEESQYMKFDRLYLLLQLCVTFTLSCQKQNDTSETNQLSLGNPNINFDFENYYFKTDIYNIDERYREEFQSNLRNVTGNHLASPCYGRVQTSPDAKPVHAFWFTEDGLCNQGIKVSKKKSFIFYKAHTFKAKSQSYVTFSWWKTFIQGNLRIANVRYPQNSVEKPLNINATATLTGFCTPYIIIDESYSEPTTNCRLVYEYDKGFSVVTRSNATSL